MREIKALIFDLDNTLLDRTKTFYQFSTKLIEKYFRESSPDDKMRMINQIIEMDQDGYKDKKQLFSELLELYSWPATPSHDELMNFYNHEYVESAVLMDHAFKVIEHFRNKYKIGLITNGRTDIQYGKIDKLNIRSYFDTIIVSEEAGVKKPDPRIFNMALAQLNAAPEACIYIGDHPVNDIEGASRAGLYTIWMKVNQPWKDELTAKPIHTVTNLSELTRLL